MESKVKKNEHFWHLLFAFNQGYNATKAADFYSGDFVQRGIENHVERWEVLVKNGEYILD